jgi:hypothetical protein
MFRRIEPERTPRVVMFRAVYIWSLIKQENYYVSKKGMGVFPSILSSQGRRDRARPMQPGRGSIS